MIIIDIIGTQIGCQKLSKDYTQTFTIIRQFGFQSCTQLTVASSGGGMIQIQPAVNYRYWLFWNYKFKPMAIFVSCSVNFGCIQLRFLKKQPGYMYIVYSIFFFFFWEVISEVQVISMEPSNHLGIWLPCFFKFGRIISMLFSWSISHLHDYPWSTHLNTIVKGSVKFIHCRSFITQFTRLRPTVPSLKLVLFGSREVS